MCTARPLIFALLFLVARPAGAEDSLARLASGDWPDGAALESVAGREVTFPSTSPFGLSELGDPGGPAKATRARGSLFLPAEAGEGVRAPAVILLHGAAGVLYQRELTYAKQFAAMGIAALVVDAFASRRDRARGFVERLLEVTETMMIADAYSGLRYLSGLPSVDPSRVALMGFSYGGMASVLAAYRQVAIRAAPDGLRFAAHVAFYGPCIARFADKRATGAPLLMVWGTEDALIDSARCGEIKRDLEAGGAAVRTVAYKGAYHQWDGSWDGPFEIGRNLADCRLSVGRDGIARDERTYLPMTGPLLRRVILALCVDSEGYLIGRDDRVRALSNRDVGVFLAAAFRRHMRRAEPRALPGTPEGG